MNRDRWLKLEFAVLMVLMLFGMALMARYAWRAVAALF